MKSYYKPWIGKAYKPGGLLILSESAYCWEGGRPKPSHPTKHTVKFWALSDKFESRRSDEARYIVAITRALTKLASPTAVERAAAWERIAYCIYIQRVMEHKRQRPTKNDFESAFQPFLDLIEKLRPGRVVITSITAWNQMPPTQVEIDEYKQAYRLNDGSLIWCLAVPHPASRKKGHGFKWSAVGAKIEAFKAEHLPAK